MSNRLFIGALSVTLLTISACVQKPANPAAADSATLHQMHHPAANDSAFAALQQRGKTAMGVDQYASRHQFEALPDGGRIVLQQPGGDSERQSEHESEDSREHDASHLRVHARIERGPDVVEVEEAVRKGVADQPGRGLGMQRRHVEGETGGSAERDDRRRDPNRKRAKERREQREHRDAESRQRPAGRALQSQPYDRQHNCGGQ